MNTQDRAESPKRNSIESTLVSAIIVFGVLFVAACLILPHLSGSNKSKLVYVIANLKQIDVAKGMWADDHHATGAVPVTTQDLTNYLRSAGSNALVRPVDGEVYTVNPLGVPPEARLTCAFSKTFPKGTVVRLPQDGPRSGWVEWITPDGIVHRPTGSNSSAATNQATSAVEPRP